jgi:hypothetical protein
MHFAKRRLASFHFIIRKQMISTGATFACIDRINFTAASCGVSQEPRGTQQASGNLP